MRSLKALVFAMVLSISVIFSSCAAAKTTDEPVNPITKTDFLLDTVCTVTVFSESDEKAADDALSMCAEYEKMFSRTIADSDISRINAAAGNPSPVSRDTLELLEKAIYYGELSEGLFDVSIGAVSSMWNFADETEEYTVPFESAITDALLSVDYSNIEILSDAVQLKDDEMRLDLGGIAKGYIADKMSGLLEERGVKSAIIDLGGNIVTVGNKADGKPWKVGVRNPLPADGESGVSVIGTVTVDGHKSIGSSGTYERYFERDGVRYHHILDPETGYPAATDLAGVTIVTDLSVDGEGFSTFCILLGSAKAKDFLDENNIQAVLVREDGTIITTAGIAFTAIGEE